MCNLNQVFGGMQRYHYSCCRRKTQHIVEAPCCCGRDRSMPESSELCCPRRISGISTIPAAVRTLADSKVPGRSSSKTIQGRENNQSSNNSVKTISKRSPIQTKLSHKGSMGNSVKSQRKAGGSVDVQKNKGPCMCTICEESALMSGCSSSCNCDSTNSIFSTKSKRKSQEIKPRNSKSEPQNADLKALVRAKPKRKRIVARKWPLRSTECPIEAPTQENNDDDGVWFECNLPFRVNIPFPISMQNIFGLQTFSGKGNTQSCHSKALVPTRNLTQNGRFGTPFCLTMRNKLPAPVPEPEPSTSKAPTYLLKKKGLRRGKNRPCPCETSTQTGEEDPVLCCLEQIRNQLAARSSEGQENTPSRYFAEKSTNVRTHQAQKKDVAEKGTAKTSEEKQENIILKSPKIAEESSATSLESSSSKSSEDEVVKSSSKTKKTGKKPKKTKSIESTKSVKKKSSSSSQKEILKNPTKAKETEKKLKKTKSIESTKSVQKSSSKSSQKEILKNPTKAKETEKKPKKTKSITSTRSVKKNTSKTSQKGKNRSKEKLHGKEESESLVDKPKEAKKSKEKDKNRELIDPEQTENHSQEKLQNINIKSEAEKPNKSPQPRKNLKEEKSKNPEWINPEPVRGPSVCFYGHPPVFPENPSAMIQGSGYQPNYMYSWHNPMYQPQHYPEYYYQQSWQSWETLEPDMPIFPSTESNNNATFNRNSTPERGIQSESNSQEPNSQTSKIYGQSIMKRVSGEGNQGVREIRSVNNQPSISFRGCVCHSANNSVNSLDKSKISDKTRNTNDAYSYLEKSPEQINQQDSKSKNSYDAENKYESSERSYVRKELPSSRENSKDRIYKTEESSGSQNRAKDTESLESSKKHSEETLRRSSAEKNALENNNKKMNRSLNSETLSQGTESPRSFGRKNNADKKYESSERSNVRRELPSSLENSKDRIYKAEESSGSQNRAKDTESLESSKRYSNETLRGSSAETNALENNKKKINRSPNSETLSRGSESSRSYGRKNKSEQDHQSYDRISSGGETIGSEEFDGMPGVRKGSYDDQFHKESCISPNKHSPEELPSPSQDIEVKSVSGITSKDTISQEFYFPLNEPNSSFNLQDKIGTNTNPKASLRNESDNSNGERSLSRQISLGDDDVINTDEYQSNSKRSSENKASGSSRKRTMEPRTIDNIPYNQKNSIDTKSEDQTSIRLTNRSSSINSGAPIQVKNSHYEKISSQYSDENQRKSQNLRESNGTDQKASDADFRAPTLQKVPSVTKMYEEMTSPNSEIPRTKVRRMTGSITTEPESPSTSYKSSENFDSRIIYSQFKRQSSENKIDLNQAFENNVSYDRINRISRESNPKDQSIPSLNASPVNGVDIGSNVSQYLPEAENCQSSLTNNTNQRFINKKKRSLSAPACLVLRYKRPFVYCRSLSPSNQSPGEYCTLPLSTENVLVIQDESCESEMDTFPTESMRNQQELDDLDGRIGHYPLQKGGKDMSVGPSDCRTPDYSINYSIMQNNYQTSDERVFIPREVPERAPKPRYKPEYKNMHQGSSRNLGYLNADYQNRSPPPMVLVPFRMESREIVNVCQPDEWRELRLHLSRVTPSPLHHLQAGRSQPRKPSTEEYSSAGYHSTPQYHQNTVKNPYVRNLHHKNISKTRPMSNTSFSQSEEEYFPLYFSRPNTPEENNYRKCNQRDISSKKRTTLEPRQRKPRSFASLSQSEKGYVSHSRSKTRVDKMEPKATRKSPKLSISSDTSRPHSPGSRFNKSVESKGRRKVTGDPSHDSYNHETGRKLGGNSQISLCRSDCRCYMVNRDNSGSQTSEFSGLTSKDTVVTSTEHAQHSGFVVPCKPTSSLSKTIESEATTDVETLETVTLMPPRRLRSKESTRIRNQDRDTENTVLLAIRTTCKKDNLLETCGRPPCSFHRQHYTGVPPIEVPAQSRNYQRSLDRVPQNGNPFEENYLIDPRDHWRTDESPTFAPAPGYQQRHMQSGQRPYHPIPFPNPGYDPEPVWEKIKELPEGFYDQTINKYNIIRMDSDFQPPPLGPEIIQVLRAHQQFNCGRTGCLCGNPIQRQLMGSVQDFTRPFILPQNQFHPRLPNQSPPFCPTPNVKLDGYDQSESQF